MFDSKVEDFNELRDKVGSEIDEAKDAIGDKVDEINDTVDDVKDVVDEKVEEISEKAEDVKEAIDEKVEYVKERAVEINEEYKVTTRAIAGVGLVGDIATGAAGVVAMTVPEPVSTGLGGAVALNSLNNAHANYKTLITGEEQKTMLEKGVAETAEFLGASEEVAENIGTAVQTGVDFTSPKGAGKNVASEVSDAVSDKSKRFVGDADIAEVRALRTIPSDKNAIAVARTNIPELDKRYEGYAPQVRRAAKPKMPELDNTLPDRPIRAPDTWQNEKPCGGGSAESS